MQLLLLALNLTPPRDNHPNPSNPNPAFSTRVLHPSDMALFNFFGAPFFFLILSVASKLQTLNTPKPFFLARISL